jgi:hypothetical protein
LRVEQRKNIKLKGNRNIIYLVIEVKLHYIFYILIFLIIIMETITYIINYPSIPSQFHDAMFLNIYLNTKKNHIIM